MAESKSPSPDLGNDEVVKPTMMYKVAKWILLAMTVSVPRLRIITHLQGLLPRPKHSKLEHLSLTTSAIAVLLEKQGHIPPALQCLNCCSLMRRDPLKASSRRRTEQTES